MKIKPLIVIAALAVGIAQSCLAVLPAALPEFKPQGQSEQFAALRRIASNLAQSEPFFTGKPYEETGDGYLFKYRNYDPSLSRWTSFDPSGFPDGANNFAYVNNKVVWYFDDSGLTGKSVLLITVGNLFGNGDNFSGATGNGSSVNYVDSFVNGYNSTKQSMQQWDNSHTKQEGWYLRDGDIFDKRVVTSNDDLLNVANGYDKVFYISHGDVDAQGNYTMMTPDGNFQSTSFFSSLIGGTNVGLGTCYNGFSPSGGNTFPLTGDLTTITWSTALNAALQQAKTYLWE